WGTYIAFPRLGFGVQRQEIGGTGVTDYRIGLADGSSALAIGVAYGWSKGDFDALGRERLVTAGGIIRPTRYLSLGLIGSLSLQSRANEGIAEIGVRPLGTSRLTVFADGAIQHGVPFKDAPFGAGAAVELARGICLVGRYFDSEAFTLGLTIDFGKFGIGSQSHYDADQNHAYYTHSVRLGGMKPSIFPELFETGRRYLAVNLKGTVDYQTYRFFDKGTIRFADLLRDIRAATADPRVAAIAVNFSDMRIRPEHAWEVREELRQAQAAGKKVVAFIERCGMTGYHLASVADAIVLDPEGAMMLTGHSLSRTYFKGTLAKLGLGFDEWRFYKYKSAAEKLSRDRMSDADREQRQAYVDDWYELVRGEVCRSRNLSHEEYDRLIDDEGYIMASVALKAGLVDTLARWSDAGAILRSLVGRAMWGIKSKNLLDNALPPAEWGPQAQIAIVYGLGECATDRGIRARWLEKVFLGLAHRPSVKAVVFRVDSPGGDRLASDMVAQALKKCAREKPVIISQGQVAASGGYYISMYGDTILAGPNSITGSIGVIGGWVYDLGFSGKLGMSSDHVTRGKSADVGLGVTVPFLGITIPARNLTTDERARVEGYIGEYYDDFVEKVAAGRGMSVDEIRAIGEGRVYSGIDGKQVGLVDEIGGLMRAVAIAAEKAGLQPDQDIELIEISKYKGLINLPLPKSPITTEIENNPVLWYLKIYSDHIGEPLPMLPPGFYPTFDN
ncbi:MAG: S49 family peptidase, partial [Candidatus Zixiibacteriota bacterium]